MEGRRGGRLRMGWPAQPGVLVTEANSVRRGGLLDSQEGGTGRDLHKGTVVTGPGPELGTFVNTVLFNTPLTLLPGGYHYPISQMRKPRFGDFRGGGGGSGAGLGFLYDLSLEPSRLVR